MSKLLSQLELLLETRIGPEEPGAVIGVFHKGQLVEQAARGLASLDTRSPLTPTTVLDVASVSKQMTAATLLCLAHDGQVDLDAPLTTYLPAVRSSDITLRHCLQHCSGLPDYLAFEEMRGVPVDQACSLDHFVNALEEYVAARQFVPGTQIRYSNTGYVLAALVAEEVTGLPWDEIVQSRVFSPLGMARTRACVVVESPTATDAHGYSPDRKGGFVRDSLREHGMAPGVRIASGDGEVKTSAEDLALWNGFLADGRVLGAGIREQLLQPCLLSDGRRSTYGMGVWWRELGGIRAYGHSGSMCGYTAYTLTSADDGTGVAVLSNRSDTRTGDLAWRVLREALQPCAATGAWASVVPLSVLHASQDPTGGLAVEVDGVASQLACVGANRWAGPETVCELRVTDFSLITSDHLGAVKSYQRCEPVDLDPAAVAGNYVCESIEGALEISVGTDGLWLRVCDTVPQLLDTIGELTDGFVLRSSTHLVIVASDGTLMLGSEAAQLRWHRLRTSPA